MWTKLETSLIVSPESTSFHFRSEGVTMEEWLKFLLSALGGASTVGFPLWWKIRKAQQKLQAGDQDLRKGDVDVQTKEHQLKVSTQIDSEAEWKRIIEFREADLVRLRDKDEQQEKRINDLYDKHVACQKNEAAQAEQIKMLKANQDRDNAERKENREAIAELRVVVGILKTKLGE